jgi:glycosyltransferase involved in cell wall biosynthesis
VDKARDQPSLALFDRPQLRFVNQHRLGDTLPANALLIKSQGDYKFGCLFSAMSQPQLLYDVLMDCRLMYYRQAGIAQYARRLLRALAAQANPGFRLWALLDRRDRDLSWLPANVRVLRTITPAHHRYEFLLLPLELMVHRRFQSPRAVLHSPDFITCRGRFRKVITIHDLYFLEHPEAMSADGLRYYRRVRWSARHADRVIAVSDFTRADISRLMPELPSHKVCVIHEAPDELTVVSSADAPCTPHERYVLFVGTLEPRKNLATLLRALARLPTDIRLVVVGEAGWGDLSLGELARVLGVAARVTFSGRLSGEQLDLCYRRARLLAMPSLAEGFGLPVLEAMSRGIPVVCSAAGALPEVAGDAALFHQPTDDAALAAHIWALWTNEALHAELVRRGLARAAQFSWTRAAEQTCEVYRAALGVI